MKTSIGSDQWQDLRDSLKRLGDDFAELVVAAPNPQATALGAWSVADTAAHVVAVAWLDAVLLRPELEPPISDLPKRLAALTVDGINDFNEVVLGAFTERDPRTLAGMLRDHIDIMLAATEDADPEAWITWIGESQLPLAGLFAHMVNELLLHGYDLGRVTGRRWQATSRDAAPFFGMFLAGLATCDVGHLLDGGDRPRSRRISVEFRSGHATPVTMVLHEGRVTAEPADALPDVRLTFDPLTMTMMMFGRVSKARAILTRKVRVGGRRPWLLATFLKTFRVPG